MGFGGLIFGRDRGLLLERVLRFKNGSDYIWKMLKILYQRE